MDTTASITSTDTTLLGGTTLIEDPSNKLPEENTLIIDSSIDDLERLIPGGETPEPKTPVTDPISQNNAGNFTNDLSKLVAGNLDLSKGFGISVVSKKDNQKVNELGFFAVDDINGKIGNLNRGDVGYMKAALARSVSIFSSLNGSFFTEDKQEISLDPNKN